MDAHFGQCCENAPFKTPEMLVLEGYRHWVAGIATRGRPDLAGIEQLLGYHMPTRHVHPTAIALMNFISALGTCATCPLRTFQVGSGHLCRDEALVLALIAALQHSDDEAADMSLTALSCKSRCGEVAFAAGQLALVLKGAEQILLPIPSQIIANILALSRAAKTHGAAGSKDPATHPGNPTLH